MSPRALVDQGRGTETLTHGRTGPSCPAGAISPGHIRQHTAPQRSSEAAKQRSSEVRAQLGDSTELRYLSSAARNVNHHNKPPGAAVAPSLAARREARIPEEYAFFHPHPLSQPCSAVASGPPRCCPGRKIPAQFRAVSALEADAVPRAPGGTVPKPQRALARSPLRPPAYSG